LWWPEELDDWGIMDDGSTEEELDAVAWAGPAASTGGAAAGNDRRCSQAGAAQTTRMDVARSGGGHKGADQRERGASCGKTTPAAADDAQWTARTGECWWPGGEGEAKVEAAVGVATCG
jgi:hypothetical protein